MEDVFIDKRGAGAGAPSTNVECLWDLGRNPNRRRRKFFELLHGKHKWKLLRNLWKDVFFTKFSQFPGSTKYITQYYGTHAAKIF